MDGNPVTAPAGLFDSNNLVSGWYEAHNGDGGAAENMVVGQAYSMYDTESRIRTFTGTVNTGNQDITSLPYTNNDPMAGPLPDFYDGWNLVGNPYPSSIDWDLISGGITNMDNAI